MQHRQDVSRWILEPSDVGPLSGGDTTGNAALVRQVVTFGRVLREGGLEVGPGRIADALTALEEVDIGRQVDVYWALRTTLVTRFEEIELFDRAFNAWFLGAPVVPPTRVRVVRLGRSRPGGRGDPIRGGDHEADPDPLRAGWSATEVLRTATSPR